MKGSIRCQQGILTGSIRMALSSVQSLTMHQGRSLQQKSANTANSIAILGYKADNFQDKASPDEWKDGEAV